MRSFGPATALGAISVFAPLASAGVAAVVNHCSQPFYLWSVGDRQSDMVILPNRTVVYNETYTPRVTGGVSIKICGVEELDNSKAVQLEYTLQDPTVWYDVSDVNNENKLWDVPYSLTASDPSCPAVSCQANEPCKDVYNNWDDNAATHACGSSNDLIFTLCPGGQDPAKQASSPVGDSVSKESTDTAPKGIEFAAGKTTHADIYVDATGTIKDTTVATTTTDDTSNGTGTDTGDSSGPTIFVHANYSPGSKRSIQAHLHEHAQHLRLKRSRVFRH